MKATCTKTKSAMMDYKIALDSIAATCAKVGEPLTETQIVCLAGGLAVFIERAYYEGSIASDNHTGKIIEDHIKKLTAHQ